MVQCCGAGFLVGGFVKTSSTVALDRFYYPQKANVLKTCHLWTIIFRVGDRPIPIMSSIQISTHSGLHWPPKQDI